MKRTRESPCFICGHYHAYESGEVCAICGHGPPSPADAISANKLMGCHGAYPSEVLPAFLYLGSYDHASRADLLRAMGIQYVLNAVGSGCQNLYRNSFTYHTASSSTTLPLEECVAFLEGVRATNGRVLVHCMSGMSRSPAVVLAYLLYLYGPRPGAPTIDSRRTLMGLHQYLRGCRPVVNLKPADMAAVSQYEAAKEGAVGDEASAYAPDPALPQPPPLPLHGVGASPPPFQTPPPSTAVQPPPLPAAILSVPPLASPFIDFSAAAPPPPAVATDAFAHLTMPAAGQSAFGFGGGGGGGGAPRGAAKGNTDAMEL